MVTHAKKTALAALVTLIDALASVKRTLSYPIHSDIAVTDDSLVPTVTVVAGDDHIAHDVTSSQYGRFRVQVVIYAKDRDTLLDVDEAILDAVANAPTLTGTCMDCKPLGLDPPMLWEQPYIAVRLYEILLRRDF